MTTKRCCMLNCNNQESADVCLYGFPKDFNLCMLWVQNTGKPEHFEDFAFGGALPFLNRYICCEHFSFVDFVNVKKKSLGLLPGAVPLLNFVEIGEEFKIKEEIIDPDYNESAAEEISKLGTEIKHERCDDDSPEDNGSYAYNDSTIESIRIEPTAEEKQLSDKFFREYRNAQNRESLKAERVKKKKSKVDNMKNALRAAIRRQNETPEQREKRRISDLMRARRRRSAETEQETRIRRYNDAVRAALRRKNETKEQRAERRMYDSQRAAYRRSQESAEQRALRLKKDRERASRNRLLKRIFSQIQMLESSQELLTVAPHEVEISGSNDGQCNLPLNISTISTAVKGCNESTNLNRLQEVLTFLQETNRKTTDDTDGPDMKVTIENIHNSSNSSDNFIGHSLESKSNHDIDTAGYYREDYSVDISSIPKEIREHCIGGSDNNSTEAYMETPVTVELHEGGGDKTIPEDVSVNKNVFEFINMISTSDDSSRKYGDDGEVEDNYCVNLSDIPKVIREHCIDDDDGKSTC